MTGLALVSIPVIAPVIFTAVRLTQTGRLIFDYLMPAELFPLVLAGAGLLLWASVRLHSRRAQLSWSIGAGLVGLGGSQLAAVLTGLASGESEAEGWPLITVSALLAVYIAALIAVIVTGFQLVHDAFVTGESLPAGTAQPQG